MKQDHEGDVEKDIKKFLDSGGLPQDYDVRRSSGKSQASPYWNYVGRNLGGREPLFNSGDIPVEDGGPATDYGAAFHEWLLSDYPKMAEEDKELFTLVFEKQAAIKDVATYFKIDQRTTYRRVNHLKARIAKWCGIKM